MRDFALGHHCRGMNIDAALGSDIDQESIVYWLVDQLETWPGGARTMSDGLPGSPDLVVRIAAGDRLAEEELVRQYLRGVRTLLKFTTRSSDDAEDILQETFLTVISKIRRGEVRESGKVSGFIHGVARNLATSFYRRDAGDRMDAVRTMVGQLASDVPGPLELADQAQTTSFLQTAIDDLPVERDRKLLRRYFFEHTSVDQLCEDLGTDRRHFSRLKHRATRRLIEQVKGGSTHE